MKVMILGKNGRLGSVLLSKLSEISGVEVFSFSHRELDILDKDTLFHKVNEICPDFVINCVAYNDVIKAEDEGKEIAHALNAEALVYLSEYCNLNDSVLIHFSTDYGFDGKKEDFYLEDDHPNPLNEYGLSKFLGEKAVRETCLKYYIIRTAWLFGNGQSFVDKMIELSKSQNEIKATNDKVGSPTYIPDLADFVINNFVLERPDFGIYHGVNDGKVSRYELAKKALEIIGSKCSVLPVSSDEFPSKAVLPDFAPLLNTKLNKLRSFEEALTEYLK
jgi:dTDP-4-dehydrorhamnose reductase